MQPDYAASFVFLCWLRFTDARVRIIHPHRRYWVVRGAPEVDGRLRPLEYSVGLDVINTAFHLSTPPAPFSICARASGSLPILGANPIIGANPRPSSNALAAIPLGVVAPLEVQTVGGRKTAVRPNGGWGDLRDRALCKAMVCPVCDA